MSRYNRRCPGGRGFINLHSWLVTEFAHPITVRALSSTQALPDGPGAP